MRFVCFFLPILLVKNGDVSAVKENNLRRSQSKLWTTTSTSDIVESSFVTSVEIVEQNPVPTRSKIQETYQRQPEVQPVTINDLQLQTLPKETEHTHRQKKAIRHFDRMPAADIVKTTVTVENDVVQSRIHQQKKQLLRNERIRLVKTEVVLHQDVDVAATWDHERPPTGDLVKNKVPVGEDVVANSRDRVLSLSSSSGYVLSIRYAWGVSAFFVAWTWFV